MKKSVLKVDKQNSDEKMLVYALSTAETDLKLCIILNSCLNITLSLNPNYEVLRRKELFYFRHYFYEDDLEGEKISLIKNRSENAYFVPELKTVDYILIIRTEGITQTIEYKLEELKKVSGINVITPIDYSSVSSLKKLFL